MPEKKAIERARRAERKGKAAMSSRARGKATGRGKIWVRRVQQTSNAMDLPSGLFKRDPAAIARGLKRSAMRSRRTKGTKFQSAMSMLNLFVNRAGRSLSARDRARLEAAKGELRRVFGRPPRPGSAARAAR